MRFGRADLQAVDIVDGRASVTRAGHVLVLSEVATAILEAVPEGPATSIAEITAATVETVGTPPPPLDPLELIHGMVLELVAQGVLVDETPLDDESLAATGVSAVRDALRHVVSANPDGWIPPAAVSGPDFLAIAHRHRVVSILAAAQGRLALPELTLEKLVATARHEADGVDDLVDELTAAVGALTGAGVRVLVVEGLALSAQAHGHYAARGTDPHVLIVAADDLARAHTSLVSLGWAPSPGFPDPSQTAAWQALTVDFHGMPLTRRGGSIQLQTHLDTGGERPVQLDELWRRRTTVDIAGHAISTVASYDALALAARRVALDEGGSLRGLLDVWRLLTHEESWQDRDHPLDHHQLASLGLAVKTFGMVHTSDLMMRDTESLSNGAWGIVATTDGSDAGPGGRRGGSS